MGGGGDVGDDGGHYGEVDYNLVFLVRDLDSHSGGTSGSDKDYMNSLFSVSMSKPGS